MDKHIQGTYYTAARGLSFGTPTNNITTGSWYTIRNRGCSRSPDVFVLAFVLVAHACVMPTYGMIRYVRIKYAMRVNRVTMTWSFCHFVILSFSIFKTRLSRHFDHSLRLSTPNSPPSTCSPDPIHTPTPQIRRPWAFRKATIINNTSGTFVFVRTMHLVRTITCTW